MHMGIIGAKPTDASLSLSLIDDISVLLENYKKKLLALYDDSIENRITIGNIDFVHIPAGTFVMGSDDGHSDESPCHDVTITKDFYMSQTCITQKQYQNMMGENPSRFKGEHRPVEHVSWHDAHNFCTKFMDHFPHYDIRLATEAEWEYACRANGSTFQPLNEYAWHPYNSGRITHDVAQLKPNAFGLYDMLGNVWEWCEDKYNFEYYASSPQYDPLCEKGELAVLRGGGWSHDALNVRAPRRLRLAPAVRNDFIGFRCVLRPQACVKKE